MKCISAIICTHNPRKDFLNRAVDSLANQSLNRNLWELLVIDNASDEPIVIQYKKKLPDIKIIHEKNIGLLFARLTGIKNSNGKLIVFIDDDNVLAHNYLEETINISNTHPNLGCFGAGIIEPEFEKKIPEDLIPHQEMLALRKVNENAWSNVPHDNVLPWGAGLVVRRDVAFHYLENMKNSEMRKLLGRNGNLLLSGEDIEFSWFSCQMGYGKGLFINLKIIHLIDSCRINLDYFQKLAEGHAFSWQILDYLHNGYLNEKRYYAPSLNDILKNLIVLDFHKTLISIYRNIVFIKKSKVDKNIAKAKRNGLNKANEYIEATLKFNI